MNIRNYLESTILKADATEKDIIDLCEYAKNNNLLGICINPGYVELARKTLPQDTKIKVVTVVGFPLGQNTTKAKVYETLNAVRDGASEIDMVMNIAKFKKNDLNYCINEINEVKKACMQKPLKVIVETSLLSVSQLEKVCEMIKKTNADFIKTSTGFSIGGAEVATIELWKTILKDTKIGIKASGGISTYTEAQMFIEAGADRIGTSKAKQIIIESSRNYSLKDENYNYQGQCQCGCTCSNNQQQIQKNAPKKKNKKKNSKKTVSKKTKSEPKQNDSY